MKNETTTTHSEYCGVVGGQGRTARGVVMDATYLGVAVLLALIALGVGTLMELAK